MKQIAILCQNCRHPFPTELRAYFPWLGLVKRELSCTSCHAVLLTSGKARLLSFLFGAAIVSAELLLIRYAFPAGTTIGGWLPVLSVLFLLIVVPYFSYQLASAAACRKYADLFALPPVGS